MKKSIKYLSYMLVLCPFLAFASTIYKTTDDAGNVVFTDKPQEGAEVIKPEPITTFKAPKTPTVEPNLPTEPKLVEYALSIVTPQNEATIRDNQGNVVIQIEISPGLFPGNKLEIMMDGETVAETDSGKKTTFQLTGIERGEHTVEALVVDKTGEIIKSSDPIVFYLHKASKLNGG